MRKLRATEWVPLGLFAFLLVHGLLLGPTDDEAYYWVLSRKPALAYAYHPPMVAWVLALADGLLGWWPLLTVRFSSAALGALTAYLGLRWVEDAGGARRRPWASALTGISLPGIFALSWMMVPDLPLLVGWTTAFWLTWRILSGQGSPRWNQIGLSVGLAVAIASKYSGVLAAGSAALAIWTGPRQTRRAVVWVLLGVAVGILPAILWNATHEWASILYQIRDRHAGGGEWSLRRWLRFFGAELAAVGPVLLAYSAVVVVAGLRTWRQTTSVARYAAFWILPAGVFVIQPLFSDFKPHWAFIFFWPALLWMAYRVDFTEKGHWFALQRGWTGVLAFAVTLVCHFPLVTAVSGNPLLDVSNDLYGWRQLPSRLEAAGLQGLPVVGSWYQTASQAAFALAKTKTPVTLIPRDLKARDEWADIPGLVDHTGPDWPRLLKPAVFVADQRYSAPPAFVGAQCEPLFQFEEARYGLSTKRIGVWRCVPGSSPPESS